MKLSEIVKRFFTSVKGILLAGIVVLLVIGAVILGVSIAVSVIIGAAGLAVIFFLSLMLGSGAAAVVDEGIRLSGERNRERLEEAKQVSRKLGAVRINDEEIKKLIIRITYEADSYIQKVSAEEDAVYDPAALYALDTAAAAVNNFLKESNAISVEIHFSAVNENTEIEDNVSQVQVIREQAVRVLTESLRILKEQNAILSAGDMNAVITDMSDGSL